MTIVIWCSQQLEKFYMDVYQFIHFFFSVLSATDFLIN
nr:MAG TPA: hypothetical protein [Caudoviricetes sp.]